MRKYIISVLLFFLVFSLQAEDTVLKVIELSWTLPQDYIDFIERNRSSESSYTVDDIRNVIIIDDTPERVEFMESYIRKLDLSSRDEKVIKEELPVFLKLEVDNGERFEMSKELSSGQNWNFNKQHPLVYSSIENGEEKYSVEMLGIRVVLWFEKISEQRAIVRLDIFYDYVMGWNNRKHPIIDRTMKTLDFIVYLGDKKKLEGLELGNRVIDCEFELGYNMLIYEKDGR